MKCTDCKYCLEEDYGYSNWTVEGTEVECLLGINPDFPVDRFYGEELSLKFAENCKKFVKGDHPHIDVDFPSFNYDELTKGVKLYASDPDVIELLKAKLIKKHSYLAKEH